MGWKAARGCQWLVQITIAIQFIAIKIIVNCMELKTDDLVAFCAYYSLAKAAVRLPLTCLPPSTGNKPVERTKNEKVVRKKLEVTQSKKAQRTIKPKIQQVPKSGQKKSVSPIDRIDLQEIKEDKNKKYDLNYFMSHMSAHPTVPNSYDIPYRQRDNQYTSSFTKKYQEPLQNYQSFGKNAMKNVEFQTFEEKVYRESNRSAKITNRGNYTDRSEVRPLMSQYTPPQQPKINFYDSYMQPFGSQNFRKNDKFIDLQSHGRKASYYGAPQEQYSNQYNESKLTYSPSARSYNPATSSIWIKNSPSPDSNLSNLSKSRSKHQRKKSQRPFYDASKLTLKQQNQPKENRSFEQSILTQSYVTLEDTPANLNQKRSQLYDVKRSEAYDAKRQTSTTAPPRMNRQPMRAVTKIDRSSIDLDDGLGETLSQLEQRPSPIAFQVKIKSKY